jgi:hypothetical protein
MTSLDPVRVALGGCVVLVGIAVRGVADAARPAHDPWAEEA